MNKKIKKVLIITKQVALDYYKKEYKTKNPEKLKKILKEKRLNAKELLREHNTHYNTLEIVKRTLAKNKIKYKIATKSKLKPSDFKNIDLIMPVGGDGTFIEASDYIYDSRLIFGVNSDLKRSKGFFMCANSKNFKKLFKKFLQNKYKIQKFSRPEAMVYNEETCRFLAVNDIFVGKPKSTQMARYYIKTDNQSEYQQSSGIVISSKDGAKAWLMNIKGSKSFKNHEKELQFINREPKNMGKHYKLNQGFAKKITIKSDDYNMIVSIDGSEGPFLFDLNKGHKVIIRLSKNPLRVVKF